MAVAGGSYSGFSAASGVSVVGGYDQNFVAGGPDGATAVTVTADPGAVAVTAANLAQPLTLKNLTLVGGGGANATAVLVSGSTVTLDGVTASSGNASGAGSSAYGVRAINGSTVTVNNSHITSGNGVAGANGADGTDGAAGPNGGNGSNGNNAGGGPVNSASPAVRTGGNGGNGLQCGNLLNLFCIANVPRAPGGVGGNFDPRCGSGGSAGTDVATGGCGAGAGSPTPPSAAVSPG